MPIPISGLKTTAALSAWQGQDYSPQITNAIRIWPHHNNTGGFFIALIEKTAHSYQKKAITLNEPSNNSLATHEQTFFSQGLNLRFGIDASMLSNYHWHHHNKHTISLNSPENTINLINTSHTGLPIIHTHGNYPKVTSAGALYLGALARKNKLALTAKQLNCYLQRQVITLNKDQIKNLSPGAIFVSYQGHTIGLGQYKKNAKDEHLLESLLPKRWSQTTAT